jgi:transcriptional regulator with XRE-family HTH domain
MRVIPPGLRKRNEEIGQLLRAARGRKHVPVTKCADLVGTSRRRYVSLESGEVAIGVAELEALMDFLEISIDEIWHGAKREVAPHQVVIQALPGEPVQILLDIRS